MAISDGFCYSRHSSTIFPASGNYRREWFSVLPPEDVEPKSWALTSPGIWSVIGHHVVAVSLFALGF
jgi:hypothetical protein